MRADPGDLLDAEDAKLVTLARAARGRVGTPDGAAVRDTDGRTYSAGSVRLASLPLSAIQAAVALAAASGAPGLEAVAVVGADPAPADLAAARDLARGPVPVLVVDPSGATIRRVEAS
jgi:hypothetical protein